MVGSLAAPLHDIAKDELDSEDIRQRKSTIRLLITGVIVLVLALVAAVITGYQAEQQREKAVAQRQDAQRQRAHAEREQKVAEEQRRLASVRALLAEAETARGRDPQKALRLDLAANTLRPDAETRGALVTALTGTRYGGTSNIGNISATDAAALSPDGSLLAATDDGTGVLYLWDVRRPGQDSPLSSLGARDEVEGVAFSSDGNLLAVAARDAGVELWDVSTPRTPHKLSSPHAGQVTGAAFAPDGRTLITVGGEGDNKGKLTVWDIRRPAEPRELASLTHVEDASTVVLSPDGRTLITTSEWMRSNEEPVDKDSITHRTGLTVWDVRQPQRPVKLDRIDGWDAGPVFSPDSRTFAVGQYNRVTLWRNDLGQAPRYVSSLTGEPSTPQSLAFGKDEKTLASGYEDGAVVTWDITEPAHPRRTARLLGHTDRVETVGFLERSHQLISLDLDGAVIRWRLTSPQPSRLASLPTADYVSRATALSPDGRTVAMGGVDE
ncbi:hypothetical protein JBE27_38890, partial [Streptomyces albiflaviniger]|nr:hypothetical protein [Streptomyces albiflaviniger]